MFGMNDLLKQAQEMQQKMAQMQEELGAKTVEGSSGGGMVRVVANGKQEVLSIKFDPAVIDASDPSMMEDLALAAVNDALRQARQMAEGQMASLTGGLKIPGLS